MPLTLRDLAAFMVPTPSPTIGTDSLHEAAGGLRQLGQLEQQGQIAQMQNQQRQAELAQRAAAEAAQLQAAKQEQQQRAAQSKRAAALKAYGDFSQSLMKPGGAARAETQLPLLKASGITWQATPDGGYAFSYLPDGAPGGENWGQLDLNKLTADDRNATVRMLGAAQRAQSSRQPGQVAQAGVEAVTQDPTLAGKEALTAYEGVTNPQLSRIQSEENARRQAAATAALAANKRVGEDLDPNNVNKAMAQQRFILQNYQRQASTIKLQEDIAQGQLAIDNINSGNPLQQGSAFFARLHANQGSRPTDRDLQYELAQSGKLNQIQKAFAAWTDEGRFPERYRQLFADAAQVVLEYDRKRLATLARSVGDTVRRDPSIGALVGMGFREEMANQNEEMILRGGGSELPASQEAPPSPHEDPDSYERVE